MSGIDGDSPPTGSLGPPCPAEGPLRFPSRCRVLDGWTERVHQVGILAGQPGQASLDGLVRQRDHQPAGIGGFFKRDSLDPLIPIGSDLGSWRIDRGCAEQEQNAASLAMDPDLSGVHQRDDQAAGLIGGAGAEIDSNEIPASGQPSIPGGRNPDGGFQHPVQHVGNKAARSQPAPLLEQDRRARPIKLRFNRTRARLRANSTTSLPAKIRRYPAEPLSE